jgi:membrane-associated phospholipid phosphatase
MARSAALASLALVCSLTCVFAGQAWAQLTDNSTLDERDKIFYPGDTEKPGPLASKLARNFLLDQKEIWTSPFHMKRSNAGWWIAVTGITAALIATDEQTSKILENSKGQVRFGNDVSYLGSMYTVIPFAAGFYVVGAFVDDPKARETGVLGGEAMLDGLIVMEVLKNVAGRNRPNSIDAGEFFDRGASFPSGHSIASFALAAVIAHEYKDTKWVPIVAYSLAAAVGGARFAARQHYASDIFAGAAIGYFLGTYVYNTHENHALHYHHAALSPLVQPSTGTFGLAVNFAR